MTTTELLFTNQAQVFESFLCPRCKTTVSNPQMHGWVKDYTSHADHTSHYHRYGYCLVPCPACAGLAQAQRQTEQIARLLGDSHIPHYMATWSFASAPAEVDEQALVICKRFAKGDIQERGLFLHGDLGIGKTGLAISIVRTAIGRGEPAAFLRSLDLLNRLREAVARSRHYEPEDGDAVLEMARTVRWLALDDLATERPTPFVLEQLYALIEARRSASLYTVFTCNFNLSQLEAQWRPPDVPAGGFHAGRRLVERLGEYCVGVAPKNGNLRRRGRTDTRS